MLLQSQPKKRQTKTQNIEWKLKPKTKREGEREKGQKKKKQWKPGMVSIKFKRVAFMTWNSPIWNQPIRNFEMWLCVCVCFRKNFYRSLISLTVLANTVQQILKINREKQPLKLYRFHATLFFRHPCLCQSMLLKANFVVVLFSPAIHHCLATMSKRDKHAAHPRTKPSGMHYVQQQRQQQPWW